MGFLTGRFGVLSLSRTNQVLPLGDIPHVAHCTTELFELCQKPAVLALVTIQVWLEQ